MPRDIYFQFQKDRAVSEMHLITNRRNNVVCELSAKELPREFPAGSRWSGDYIAAALIVV